MPLNTETAAVNPRVGIARWQVVLACVRVASPGPLGCPSAHGRTASTCPGQTPALPKRLDQLKKRPTAGEPELSVADDRLNVDHYRVSHEHNMLNMSNYRLNPDHYRGMRTGNKWT